MSSRMSKRHCGSTPLPVYSDDPKDHSAMLEFIDEMYAMADELTDKYHRVSDTDHSTYE